MGNGYVLATPGASAELITGKVYKDTRPKKCQRPKGELASLVEIFLGCGNALHLAMEGSVSIEAFLQLQPISHRLAHLAEVGALVD
jgi:hypothetical protein